MNSIAYETLRRELASVEATLSLFAGSRRADLVHQSIYGDLITNQARERTGANWRSLKYIWERYENGLNEARRGHLNQARHCFDEADACRSLFAEASQMRQLIDVSALPAVAYLRYKEEAFAQAESLLRDSIDNDEPLLTDGFYVLEYHRVQQLHNLARLYFRQGEMNAGARMIGSGLRFLVYGQAPETGLGWSDTYTAQVPVQLRSDMIYQLASETIGVLLQYPAEESTLYREAFSNLTFWDAQTDDEAAHLNWFDLKDQFISEAFESFLTGSLTFLTGQPAHFDVYKLSLVMNLAEGLKQRNCYTADVHRLLSELTLKLTVNPRQRETCLLLLNQQLGVELD